jgi:hypothetical protein
MSLKKYIPGVPSVYIQPQPMYYETQSPGLDPVALAEMQRVQAAQQGQQGQSYATAYSAGSPYAPSAAVSGGRTTYGGTVTVQRQPGYQGPVLDLQVQTQWGGASAADAAYRQLELDRQALLDQQRLPPSVDQVAPSTVASAIPGPTGGASTYGTLVTEEAQAPVEVSTGPLMLEEKKSGINWLLIGGIAVLFFIAARRFGTK